MVCEVGFRYHYFDGEAGLYRGAFLKEADRERQLWFNRLLPGRNSKRNQCEENNQQIFHAPPLNPPESHPAPLTDAARQERADVGLQCQNNEQSLLR
jgi:hypothetical protein